jgi:hypothetical protein
VDIGGDRLEAEYRERLPVIEIDGPAFTFFVTYFAQPWSTQREAVPPPAAK